MACSLFSVDVAMNILIQQITGAQSPHRALLLWLSLLCFILVGAGCFGALPAGICGVLPFVMALGGILNALGERVGVIREYFGGGPIVVIFGTSLMVAAGAIPANISEDVIRFMRSEGFLSLFISALIAGSLLGMDRRLLLKAAIWYVPVILGGVLVSLVAVGLTGLSLGQGFMQAVFFVGLPIMGGGMGAGAVPLAEILANILDIEAAEALSKMVPAVVLGNMVAIICAGLLEKLGKVKPELSGDGRLMKAQNGLKEVDESAQFIPDLAKAGTGLFIATGFYVIGHLLSLLIPLHPYALMIFSVGLVKALGIMPEHLEESAALWGDFVLLSLTPALLACIGIGFTNLGQVADVITLPYLLLVLATVAGAIVGTAFTGWLLGFFPIEAAITAGLCMANMGGSGDVAVLSASRRMILMPFAQVSSRLGGALILLLASGLLSLF